MTRVLASLGVAAAVLAAQPLAQGSAAGEAAGVQGAPQPSPDVEIQILVSGKAVYRDGTGPAQVSGNWPFGIPGSPSYEFSAGKIAQEGGCSMGMSTPAGLSPDPLPPVWWVVRAQMVSKQLAGATIDFAWQRRLNSPFVAGPALVERTRRLTLVEGRPHILDYVPIESETGNCDAVLVEAEIQFVDPPSVAGAELDYDLWLVQTSPVGSERARRLVLSGAQEETLEYRFSGTDLDPNGRSTDEEVLTMDVYGTVKGRARTDGRIDLLLHVTQGFGTRSAGRTTGRGNKALIVRPGEVVEIPLPPVTGTVGEFDLGKIFAGQRTALRVVARRVS